MRKDAKKKRKVNQTHIGQAYCSLNRNQTKPLKNNVQKESDLKLITI